MPAPTVAVVTTHNPLGFDIPAGELSVVPAFNRAGAQATALSWHDGADACRAFDHVLIRTPWDYFDFPEKFETFLTELDDGKTRVHNPASVLRWNMHKRYLVELSKSAPVIETVLVQRGEILDVTKIARERNWSKGAVQKPAVGGGARETFIVKEPQPASPAAEDTLVQPFFDAIGTRGELSLIYFGGALSHIVQKTPRSGDFRVQAEHGGRVDALDQAPGDAEVAAGQVLAAAAEVTGVRSLSYARVDGIMTDAGFRLMELELIEPELFLEWSPATSSNGGSSAVDRLVQTVLA